MHLPERHTTRQNNKGALNSQSALENPRLRPAGEWFTLENKPATQLERSRICRRAGVGVELRAPKSVYVTRKVRMIQEVKRLPAQLEVLAFGKLE